MTEAAQKQETKVQESHPDPEPLVDDIEHEKEEAQLSAFQLKVISHLNLN